MPAANAVFSGVINERESALRAEAANREIFPNNLIVPDDPYGEERRAIPIYFYNVSPQEFRFSRLPNHRNIVIPACPEGRPYIEAPGAISHPFLELHEDQNGNRLPVPTNGYREATRLLSPMNPGVDQDWDAPDSMAEGGNLNTYGVFWSTDNPPRPEEVEAAKRRMEATYRKELEIMVAIEAREGVDGARSRANNVSRAAANYFGKSFSWFQADLARRTETREKVRCWACANDIMAEAVLCVHCGAPMAEDKREAWLERKFQDKKPRING